MWYSAEQPVRPLNETRNGMFGMGNGGQRLFVMPSLDLAVVTFSGNYNRVDQWMNPTLVLQRLVLAGLEV